MNPQPPDKALSTPLGPPIRNKPQPAPVQVKPGIQRGADGKLSTNLPAP